MSDTYQARDELILNEIVNKLDMKEVGDLAPSQSRMEVLLKEILERIGSGGSSVDIGAAVTSWLENHPEALKSKLIIRSGMISLEWRSKNLYPDDSRRIAKKSITFTDNPPFDEATPFSVRPTIILTNWGVVPSIDPSSSENTMTEEEAAQYEATTSLVVKSVSKTGFTVYAVRETDAPDTGFTIHGEWIAFSPSIL